MNTPMPTTTIATARLSTVEARVVADPGLHDLEADHGDEVHRPDAASDRGRAERQPTRLPRLRVEQGAHDAAQPQRPSQTRHQIGRHRGHRTVAEPVNRAVHEPTPPRVLAGGGSRPRSTRRDPVDSKPLPSLGRSTEAFSSGRFRLAGQNVRFSRSSSADQCRSSPCTVVRRGVGLRVTVGRARVDLAAVADAGRGERAPPGARSARRAGTGPGRRGRSTARR